LPCDRQTERATLHTLLGVGSVQARPRSCNGTWRAGAWFFGSSRRDQRILRPCVPKWCRQVRTWLTFPMRISISRRLHRCAPIAPSKDQRWNHTLASAWGDAIQFGGHKAMLGRWAIIVSTLTVLVGLGQTVSAWSQDREPPQRNLTTGSPTGWCVNSGDQAACRKA
jgi:hypothetical protein